MITIPRKTSDPDWGLKITQAWGKPVFKVTFREDGNARLFTLKTATTVEEARILRDTLFTNLRKRYEPRVSGKGGRLPRRGLAGIYQRKPFYVRIGGVQVGEYDTLDEAKKARRAYRQKLKQ